MDENVDKWIRFLDPENLKGNLLATSLYIAFYESFKDSVVEQVKFFYNTGFNEEGDTFSSDYQKKVLSKDKKVLNASLKWLQELGAIDNNDLQKTKEIIDFRNKITHEMFDSIFNGVSQDLPKHFVDLITLKIKIEKWWILNIEIPTNHDPGSDSEINENGIITSTEILYKVISDVLSDDEKTAAYYRNEFWKSRINKN